MIQMKQDCNFMLNERVGFRRYACKHTYLGIESGNSTPGHLYVISVIFSIYKIDSLNT